MKSRSLFCTARRPAIADRTSDWSRGIHDCLCRDPEGCDARYRHQFFSGWDKTRAWILARPMTGFAETFSQYIMEVQPGGGSEKPEPDDGAEAVLFAFEGGFTLTIDGKRHAMGPGSYAFIPPATDGTVRNDGPSPARFHWIRKAYEKVDGIAEPSAFVVNEQDVAPTPMPDTNGVWATTRFVDPNRSIA